MVNLSVGGTRGDYWITYKGNQYGSFETILDATTVAVEMVTDHINSLPGHSVYFLNTTETARLS
jgi:hypothetical protein